MTPFENGSSVCVIPYPLVRRRSFLHRQAKYIATAAPKAMERLLAHALQVQADTMGRRGIAPELIAAEIKALESLSGASWRGGVIMGARHEPAARA